MNAPDLLLHNGSIHTVHHAFPTAGALAVSGGRIVYAGDDAKSAAAALAPGFARIDLGGRAVFPGFIDAHMHLKVQGQRLAEPDLTGKSKEEILALVSKEAERLEPGCWIQCRGWNNALWADASWPGKAELDAVAPRHPVALTRSDAHSMWVNSKALEAAGIDNNSPEPQGGEIRRLPGGEPSGILVDTPIFQVWAAIPDMTQEQTLAAYTAAEAELFSLGLTSVGDAWQSLDDQAALAASYESGLLRLRVYGMLASADHDDKALSLGDLTPADGLFGHRFSRAAFKVVLDGSIGSQSAWLSRDYKDRPGHRGVGRYDDESLFNMAFAAASRGFQLCVHAIGDEALEQALRLFARLPRKSHGPPHRIEHFQIASAKQIERARELGLACAMQSIHCRADWSMAEQRLDPVLLGRSYPWRAALDAGMFPANGSDSPMEDGNPFHGFAAAVTRPAAHDNNGRPAALSREEALLSYTLWAAAIEGTAHLKGSLEAGKLADFIVLDRDIMRCPVGDIEHARVLATVLDGELVFGSL